MVKLHELTQLCPGIGGSYSALGKHISAFYRSRDLGTNAITTDRRTMSAGDIGFKAALDEAKKGASEGGIPIGAALVSADGQILGRGHNLRVQKSSATIHASPRCTNVDSCDLTYGDRPR